MVEGVVLTDKSMWNSDLIGWKITVNTNEILGRGITLSDYNEVSSQSCKWLPGNMHDSSLHAKLSKYKQ